ncbi:hypothetical protein THASP1DRAFT_27798 [Thamnocephalis sphaerospora]|uniref:RGS domain-containing protein n=1 Tax=Thamnocephalis sphaerospora TaxID=78915 RepID=A0A4P9XVV6_9FUNG|nr:hypothetical protein THASP1DRAFT_27798 [Thamnocephalis sphaerospora]|eukprot:RKP10426.1 hypothetical protein THASP1DRAFT_27798 [Thamnocephalis sphaerospora]
MIVNADGTPTPGWPVFIVTDVLLALFIFMPTYFAARHRRLPGLRHRGPGLTTLGAALLFIISTNALFRLTVNLHVPCTVDLWISSMCGPMFITIVAAKGFRIVLLYRVSEARYRMACDTTERSSDTLGDELEHDPEQIVIRTSRQEQADALLLQTHASSGIHRKDDFPSYHTHADSPLKRIQKSRRKQEARLSTFYYKTTGSRRPFPAGSRSAGAARSHRSASAPGTIHAVGRCQQKAGRSARNSLRETVGSILPKGCALRRSTDTDNISLIMLGDKAATELALPIAIRRQLSSATYPGHRRDDQAASSERVIRKAKTTETVEIPEAIQSSSSPLSPQERVALMHTTVQSPLGVKFSLDVASKDWFYRHRHWTQCRYVFYALLCTALFQCIPLLAVQLMTSEHQWVTPTTYVQCFTSHYYWIVYIFSCVPLLAMLPALTYQMRSVRDAFYIRIEMMASMIASSAFLLIAALLAWLTNNSTDATEIQSYAASGAVLGCCLLLVVIGIIFPLIEALRLDRRSVLAMNFSDTMSDPVTFEKFKIFAIIDFSVENVLFYERVRRVRLLARSTPAAPVSHSRAPPANTDVTNVRLPSQPSFTESLLSPRVEKELRSIFETFIRPGAEYEVNLDHVTRQAILTRVASNCINARMYDAAFRETTDLMLYNTFPRFLRWTAGHDDLTPNDSGNENDDSGGSRSQRDVRSHQSGEESLVGSSNDEDDDNDDGINQADHSIMQASSLSADALVSSNSVTRSTRSFH